MMCPDFSRNSDFSRFAPETRLWPYLKFEEIIQNETSLSLKFGKSERPFSKNLSFKFRQKRRSSLLIKLIKRCFRFRFIENPKQPPPFSGLDGAKRRTNSKMEFAPIITDVKTI